MWEHMFDAIRNQVLDGLDLAVEFATLGEYRLDGRATVSDLDEECAKAAFEWPARGSGARRGESSELVPASL